MIAQTSAPKSQNRSLRYERLKSLLITRALPFLLIILGLNALHRVDVAVAFFGYVAWMTLEAIAEDPSSNRQARLSKQDRASRSVILSAHLLAWIIPFVELIWHPSSPPSYYAIAVGSTTLLCGAALRIVAITYLGRFFTAHVQIVEGQEICKLGPYSHIRHPAYLGLFLLNVAPSVMLALPISSVLAALISAIGIGFRVKIEEKALIAAFGPQYLRYAQTTPRWLPFRFSD